MTGEFNDAALLAGSQKNEKKKIAWERRGGGRSGEEKKSGVCKCSSSEHIQGVFMRNH